MITPRHGWSLALTDALLIGIMAVLAACGLLYEYLLSHYAGRVLGAVEHAIYTTIGLMIVFMGLGSFAARRIKDAFSGFAWLELVLGLTGASSILLIAGAIAVSFELPRLLSSTFNLPADVLPSGGLVDALYQAARFLPYVAAAFLGFLIGIEIPLIARVRETLYQKHLTHNAGTIYGADYLGAGAGAAIWISWMMSLDVNQAAVYTATLNLAAGCLILITFWRQIKRPVALLSMQVLSGLLVLFLALYGNHWMHTFTDMLYSDKVVFQQQTRYQQIVISERHLNNQDTVLNLYLNGRLQFSSADEQIYHESLVHPAMAASARQQKVLVIGGGDGLALREIFKWPVKEVELVELDKQMIALFKDPSQYLSPRLAAQINKLTQDALSDTRLTIHIADAFNYVDQLVAEQKYFDVIIVDLPDPNHPDLNKLYTDYFYARLKQVLSADGTIVVQSTSPFHARNAFISIGKTLAAAGFTQVEQYQQNVPSFGQWGWSLATRQGQAPSDRLQQAELPTTLNWLTPELMFASFAFSKSFYSNQDKVKINRLGSQVLFNYHDLAWRQQRGIMILPETN
ncbi:polyamine aminopropyltransferase [Gayadomonas joobiniege]|uniref:polyamine aminopropyltransferase n=1 Tax=Gayadomonas joobiniege TaxID=1234606 RepID=UPI0003768FE8|nr:polyamine aminopropyltransferase [Gayadomonas joobiniege]